MRSFYRLEPGDLEGALQTPSAVNRARLAEALRAYHRDLGTLDAALEERLTRLAHPESRVVVTGQQAGLLLGPAFSVHKAADAALLARQLDREDRPVLPIFWVASQDHDAAEVAEASLLDLEEQLLHLTLPLPSGRPVGRIALEDGWVRQTLELIEAFAAPEEHKHPVRELIRWAAEGARSYADWFARMAQRLLADFGLIVFDPMHPALAELFVPALAHELEQPLAGAHRIEDAAAELLARGFEPQLRRPTGATNLFLEGPDGQRRLLRFDGESFYAERRYSREELRRILELDPSKLTPAAGLRPILQDAVLPTAVFVVGPGELAYATQLGQLYGLHGLQQPLLWPRLTVTWLEPPVARILRHYGLEAATFQADPQAALERAAMGRSGASENFREHLLELELLFERLAQSVTPLDPTLEGAVHRSRVRVLGHIARLERKVAAALVRREEQTEGQFARLRLHLLPHGVPQERELSFLTFLLKHGRAPLDALRSLAPGSRVTLEL
nr:bacillithiol biosynthesis cysteine-adding enzyme BshC [Deinobacterium chartae]